MLKQDASADIRKGTAPQSRSWILSLTSFFFVLLQSACSAVMAVSGLRLLIGIGSLAAASSVTHALDAIHGDRFRIPMTLVALLGTALNLYVIWRVRSLRARSASQWRIAPIDPKRKRAEVVQLWISFVTLTLLAIEWLSHIHLFGRLVL